MILRIGESRIINTDHIRTVLRLLNLDGEPRMQVVLADNTSLTLACDFDAFAVASGAVELSALGVHRCGVAQPAHRH